jgi:7-cyano-7-deazaguanine tRNA-ribosyltransferase
VVRNFRSDKSELVLVRDSADKPFYLSKSYRKLQKKYDVSRVQFCQFNPILGIIPLEISDLYPAAHYVMADTTSGPENYAEFAKTLKTFLTKNRFKKIHAEKSEFLEHFGIKSSTIRKRKMKKKG